MGGMNGRKPESCKEAYAGAIDNLKKDMESGDETGAVHEIQDSYAEGHQYSNWATNNILGAPTWPHVMADTVYIPAAVSASTAYLHAYRHAARMLHQRAISRPCRCGASEMRLRLWNHKDKPSYGATRCQE
jgi:hypothetical protein